MSGTNVKGEDIAKLINRNPGTIRNQMQSLKALRLVEGVPGPKGGYSATSLAYDVLSIGEIEGEAFVPVRRNGELIKGLSVLELGFTSVRHPFKCHGIARMLGSIKEFKDGDIIEIGPTPVNKLIIKGRVIGRDDVRNTLVYEISEMLSVPKKTAASCRKTRLSIDANSSVRDALKVFINNDAGVGMVMENDEMMGVVDIRTLANAMLEGRENIKVKTLANRNFVKVSSNALLHDIMREFGCRGRRWVVVEGEKGYEGIITYKDVVGELCSQQTLAI